MKLSPAGPFRDNRVRRYFYRSLILLVFLQCTKAVHRPVFNPNEDRWEIVRQILLHNYSRLRTLKGHAKLIIETPQAAYSANAEILINRPDSLYMKIEAALGIDIGSLFADRTRFVLYAPMQNTCYIGSTDSMDLDAFISFDLSYAKLLQILMGMELAYGAKKGVLMPVENALIYTGQNGQYQYNYLIDPYQGVVTKVFVKDKNNQIVLLKEFSRFVELSGVKIPRTIRLVRPEKKESLTLFYNRLTINRRIAAKDFRIKVPENSTIKTL